MFITHICNICCKAFGCRTHWCLFQFQKITQVVTVGEQGKASCSLPTTLLVGVVGSEMSVGGRQKVHQSWLLVESGKVVQSQVSGLCTLTKYLMFLKELLFIFSVMIMYYGSIFQKESSSFRAIKRNITGLSDIVSTISFQKFQ